MKILFKITAYFGYDSNKMETYYAVAEDSAKAEKMVCEFHE